MSRITPSPSQMLVVARSEITYIRTIQKREKRNLLRRLFPLSTCTDPAGQLSTVAQGWSSGPNQTFWLVDSNSLSTINKQSLLHIM